MNASNQIEILNYDLLDDQSNSCVNPMVIYFPIFSSPFSNKSPLCQIFKI